jgi:hypothetical protein
MQGEVKVHAEATGERQATPANVKIAASQKIFVEQT